MTWTYSGNPAASARDMVRFALGDTDAADPLVTDEEVAAAVAKKPSVELAAAVLAEHLAARYARKVHTVDGTTARAYQQRSEAYARLAARLREEGDRDAVSMPFAGGANGAALFRLGIHDNTQG